MSAFAALLLAAALGAQVGPLCGDCKGSGKVARPPARVEADLESGALLCSVRMAADPEGLGLDWMPCADCAIPEAKRAAAEEFAAETARRRAWLEARKAEVDAVVGTKMEHVETAHFVIAWNIPKVKLGKTQVRLHEAMHLYARRMEDLHAQLLGELGITDAETVGIRHELYFFEAAKHAKVAAVALTGIALNENMGGRVTLLGALKSRMVAYQDVARFASDDDFFQAVVHAVSHLIHDHVRERQHWLYQRYGWLYEGLAHHVEIAHFGVPITGCGAESGPFTHWKGKNWELNVKKAVQAGAEPSFADVIRKSADGLSAEERQFAWSWVDYLMARDPTRMDELLGACKGPQLAVRDGLAQAYGLTIGEFLDGWRAHVTATYTGKRTTPRDGSRK